MSIKNRKLGWEQKLKIALEVLREEVPLSEICRKHQLGKSTVHRWVQQVREQGCQIFDKSDALTPQVAGLEQELEETRARLGAVVVENDFLKKALKRSA